MRTWLLERVLGNSLDMMPPISTQYNGDKETGSGAKGSHG